MRDNWNDEYEFINSFLNRPGMYVGANRLDYMFRFLDGFHWSKVIIPNDKAFLDLGPGLERWLLLKESISIGTSTACSQWLMERYYGMGNYGCEKLKSYFEESRDGSKEIVNADDRVRTHIYLIYIYYRSQGEDYLNDFMLKHFQLDKNFNKNYYPLSQRIIDKIGEIEFTYENIVNYIKKMITDSYEDLWVYLCYDDCIIQVRFLYHAPVKGWVDNIDFVASEDDYDNLVILHALATIARKREHRNHIIITHCRNDEVDIKVVEVDNYSEEEMIRENETEVQDAKSLYKVYENWKENIVQT